MAKFTTRDNKTLFLRTKDKNLIETLNNVIPRLSYDEILEGKLEEKLDNIDMDSLKLSDKEDIKTLILSLAMFNNLSKPGSV